MAHIAIDTTLACYANLLFPVGVFAQRSRQALFFEAIDPTGARVGIEVEYALVIVLFLTIGVCIQWCLQARLGVGAAISFIVDVYCARMDPVVLQLADAFALCLMFGASITRKADRSAKALASVVLWIIICPACLQILAAL